MTATPPREASATLFYFNAPIGIECCVCALNATQAAKALCTTGNTLSARGQKYASASEALPSIRQGLELAKREPGQVFIREGESPWRPLAGDPADTLLTDRQRHLKTLSNAKIGDEPMRQRSLTCDDDTWRMFLELGGSSWFRKAVKAAHANKRKG